MDEQMMFTPGPWKANCFLVVSTARPGGMYGGQEICHTGGGRTESREAEANARLIAAAPDLLAFALECANDRDDRISGGLKERAIAVIANAQVKPPA